ncbi:MAG TPA: DUF1735 domain-containing protein [Puia sp.]|nr:DUF1735 domain-containing protein [Puia sp.]
MKSYSIKSVAALLLLLSVGLAGCLKDTAYDDRSIQAIMPSGSQQFIQLGLTATDASNFLFLPLGAASDNDTTLNLVPVELTSASPAPEDIAVTLSADQSVLDDYNASHNTSYTLIPTSKYSVVNPGAKVIIRKGSNRGFLQVKFKSADFLVGDWAFAFSISAVDKANYPIAGNFRKGVVGLGVNNQWDGKYSLKGYVLRAGDAVLSGNFSGFEMDLVTAGSNAVVFAELQPWANGSGVGIGFPLLTIDNSANPNPVAVSSSGGAVNAPGYDCRYDPATKTFYISFTWGAGPAARLATDTLTYIGSRD